MEQLRFPELIEGPRVSLRKHEVSLAERIFECVDKDRQRLTQFLPWVPYNTKLQDQIDYIQSTNSQWDNFQMFDFGIFLNSDQTYVGNIGVHNISWACDRCELGYWISGAFEGKGLMAESVALLTNQACNLGFNRVEIHCAPENKRSAAVPRRLGFTYEACLAQHVKYSEGQYRDSLVFARLKDQGKIILPKLNAE